MTSADDINRAIPLFYGKGLAPTPEGDADRLRAAFPTSEVPALVEEIRALQTEFFGAAYDWREQDIVLARDERIASMRSSHPALSTEALTVLAWYFEWCNR